MICLTSKASRLNPERDILENTQSGMMPNLGVLRLPITLNDGIKQIGTSTYILPKEDKRKCRKPCFSEFMKVVSEVHLSFSRKTATPETPQIHANEDVSFTSDKRRAFNFSFFPPTEEAVISYSSREPVFYSARREKPKKKVRK